MSTNELFELLGEELSEKLSGELKYTGDVIKYEYDGFHQFDIDESDLESICYEDRVLIDDYLEHYDVFFTTEPEIHDKFIYFYIEQ